ncbi:MAG: tetratricopeptide repeat protein [Parvibaculum sp.]
MSKRRAAPAAVGGSGSPQKKFEQGLRLQAQDRHEDAAARFAKVLAAEPGHFGAIKGLAECLIALKRSDEATALLDRAAADAPDNEAYLFDLAALCATVKYNPAAKALYERLLALKPDKLGVLINLANVVEELGETQYAVDLLSRAIELYPAAPKAYGNLGKVLTGTSLFDDAMACYRRAIELDPKQSTVWTNLAALFEILGRHEEALEALRTSLDLEPESDAARWNLARALLTLGHIEAGWDMYGFGFACRQRQPYRPFPGFIWEGQDLTDKTIMVWREQGIGDDLIFSTCYADLIARAGHVIIETEKRLVPLYRRTFPEATVRAESWTSTGLGNYGAVDFDYTAPAGLVASQLRRGLDTFPARVHALVPDPARVAECRAWLDTLGPGPKIGIAWTSRKVDGIRALNYTKLADWKDLFATEGLSVVNLQYTDIGEEAEAFHRDFGLTLHRMPGLDLFSDLEGAAALSACLDAAVAPPSFPVVLAAALDVPTFYYGIPRSWSKLGADHLPWFPAMRCYGLDQTTDRPKLVARITADIRAQVGR